MLIGISLISFFIMQLAPGDVTSTEASFNPKASEESRQKLRELYNLDKPIHIQYGLWLKRIVKLDFHRESRKDYLKRSNTVNRKFRFVDDLDCTTT